jgi:hypothetical protein
VTTSARVSVALLSHTNAGKTTLARTLLRRDVGAVMDRAHVTETAESHVLLQLPTGEELVLWDTPGFGDSARLLRRLERSGQPLGWFLSQVWDRFADRPFWCSQQAMRAARDSADVLLYVANATEEPEAAGYAAPELRMLQWLGKPALILLNQLGTHGAAGDEAELARQWQTLAERECPGVVCKVMPFDAFGRCWLQEHALLAEIAACLAPDARGAYDRLHAARANHDADVLRDCATAIARQVQRIATDEERVPQESLTDKARRTARLLSGAEEGELPAAEAQARQAMLQRLDATVRESTTELVRLHGLAGGASEEILAQLGREFSVARAPDPDRVGFWGGLVSGALGGLAADLAAGGLTLGAGALIGGVAGALGARKLTQQYNAGRGVDGSVVRWSEEFLAARLEAAIVRYLAVAHYGRGRGEFRPAEVDARWQHLARDVVAQRAGQLAAWLPGATEAGAVEALAAAVEAMLRDVLARLYPAAAAIFEFAERRAQHPDAR